jgi:hypothetical protein
VTLFRIVSAEKASFPVSLICEVLDVNRSSFYAWETRPPSDRALLDAWLTAQVRGAGTRQHATVSRCERADAIGLARGHEHRRSAIGACGSFR